MRAGLLLVVTAGCNWFHGLDATERQSLDPFPDADPQVDLDRDGIADIADSCISPRADGLVDVDADGAANQNDGCPFDAGAAPDTDDDGLPDPCDPFPVPGDRLRCLMAFRDPDLNYDLWRPRDGDAWVVTLPPRLYTRANASGAVVSSWPLEPPMTMTTTFDVFGRLGTARPATFGMMVRGHDATASPSDVACAMSVTTTGGTLEIVPDPARSTPLPTFAPNVDFRLRVTIAPGAPMNADNIRCELSIGVEKVVVRSRLTLPPGRFGFTAQTAALQLFGLAIYETDGAPAL